ncbi:hypothetical protein Lalb_Chr20g0115911 [Lupinus albus]|uniref:Uncharacterized protein n=1 Tax=Lupinus albus TaxID=3870 RepID=A0A6A4NPR1_LUPAL|nr:hypothetical protein Lalb_Chr20g0115911 [Lupinus albus]
MKTKYVTRYKDPSIKSVSFVRQYLDTYVINTSHMKSPPPKLPPRLSVLGLIGTSSGIFLIAAILQLGIVLCICKRKNSSRRKDSLALACLNSEGFKVLSFSQINILTEDFKNQIGSNLFIGMLPNNKLITVKDLSASIEERMFPILHLGL